MAPQERLVKTWGLGDQHANTNVRFCKNLAVSSTTTLHLIDFTEKIILASQERLVKTTEIEKTTLDIEEAGVKLRLTIVDTPGYGDGLEGADSWQTCVK